MYIYMCVYIYTYTFTYIFTYMYIYSAPSSGLTRIPMIFPYVLQHTHIQSHSLSYLRIIFLIRYIAEQYEMQVKQPR